MQTADITSMKEQRAKLISNARLIVDSAEADQRDLSEEEQAQFDSLMGQADQVEEQVETAERKARLYNAEQNLKTSTRKTNPNTITRRGATKESRELFPEVVRQWFLSGTQYASPSADVFRAADDLGISLSSNHLRLNLRTQSKTNAAGGFTVPQDFGDKIVEHLKYFAPVRDHATVLTTGDGRDLPFPINDPVAEEGAIVAEAGELVETDTTFSQKTLKAFKYGSACRLSLELLQDSAFDLESYMSRLLGQRIARKQEFDLIRGTGTSQPQGIITAATSGVASWTTTYDNLLSLFYSVDPIYRDKAIWLMSDVIASQIRALKDSQNRPIWNMVGSVPGDDANVERLFNKPVVISNSMETSGSSKKVIAFGDLTDFYIRDVSEMLIVKSEHRFVEYGLVAFYAWMRTDAGWFGTTRALKAGVTAA